MAAPQSAMSTSTLVDVLQGRVFLSNGVLAIGRADLLEVIGRFGFRGGAPERTLDRCLARSMFMCLPDGSYEARIVKVVLQDFDLSMQTPTWDAVVRHLRPRALQPSTATASSGSMQIDSEASGSAPAARPVSRKRLFEEDEEQLSEELQRYQTTYAGFTKTGLLNELIRKDAELEACKHAHDNLKKKNEDLQRKVRLLQQQKRRSAQTIQKLAAKAKPKTKSTGKSQREPITVKNVDQRMAIQRTKHNRYLTVESRISLSLRRNCSNVACADLGLVLLDDVSRWTIARSEVQTGAALMGHAISFHCGMDQDFQDQCKEQASGTLGVAIHCISQDATNGSIWQKRKLVALLLHTAYCSNLPSSEDDSSFAGSWKWDLFTSLECIADVQPVADGTAAGSIGLTHKMLQSVGCPSIWSLVEAGQQKAPQGHTPLCCIDLVLMGRCSWFCFTKFDKPRIETLST